MDGNDGEWRIFYHATSTTGAVKGITTDKFKTDGAG
jgi:hypothetical protein